MSNTLEDAIAAELAELAKEQGVEVANLTPAQIAAAGNRAQAKLLDAQLGNVGLSVEDLAEAEPVATEDTAAPPERDLTRRPDGE